MRIFRLTARAPCLRKPVNSALGVTTMITRELESALVASNFAPLYYQLCAEHPHRHLVRCPCPHKELVASLADLGTVVKERGPGRLYRVKPTELPGRFDFSFSISSTGTSAEAYFNVVDGQSRIGSNYAVLAYSAAVSSGAYVPTPSYPRPSFFSLDELRLVVGSALDLALSLGTILSLRRDA